MTATMAATPIAHSGIPSICQPFYDCVRAGMFIGRPSLRKEQMGDPGLEIPVNERNGHHVERGVRHHQHEKLSSERVDPAKYEAREDGLLDAGDSLIRIVRGPK